ncbi:MAG TPA: archease [Archaeoglobus profundus]|nr:archease [Archaeoglobus profundus]
MKYRFVNHTADIAFEVYGDEIDELIKNATLAFYDAFVDVSKLGSSIEKKLEVEAESIDYLLFNWLNELLYLFETEFFAGKDVDVEVSEDNGFKAKGIIKGDKVYPEIVKTEPKAITFHKFRVEKKDKWTAFVIIDI